MTHMARTVDIISRSRVYLRMTEADWAHGHAQGGFVDEGGVFVAQAQAAKALEPGDGAFDPPAVHAQAAVVKQCHVAPARVGCRVSADTPDAVGCRRRGRPRRRRVCTRGGPACPATGGTASTRILCWVTSWRLAPVVRADGDTPPTPVSRWSLVPFLPRSVGVFARLVPAAQGTEGSRIDRRAAPVDLVRVEQLGQQDLVELCPDPKLVPLVQNAPSTPSRCRNPSRAAGRFQGKPVLRIKRMLVKVARFSKGLRPGW